MPRCFSLILILAFALTVTFTNVNIFSTPLELATGLFDSTLFLKNLQPASASLNSLSVTFNDAEASLTLGNGENSGLSLVGAADLSFDGEKYTTTEMSVEIKGAVQVTKDHAAEDQCTSNTMSVQSCDLDATIGFSSLSLKIDLCDMISEAVSSGANVPELEAAPALVSGASSIKDSFFFRTLRVKSLISSLIGGEYSASFVGETAMRVRFGLVREIQADLDTSVLGTLSTGYQLLAKLVYSIYSTIRDALGLPELSSILSGKAANISGENVTLSLNDGSSLIQSLIANNASVVLSTYLPKGANLSFDIVVNDLKCSLGGLLCSIPKENGIRVNNVRVEGLGDADALLYNLLGTAAEDILSEVARQVIGANWAKIYDNRLYLRPV